ncbi:hypothetical protein XANCAGTX0491_000053 [Xanthoria calcicola]
MSFWPSLDKAPKCWMMAVVSRASSTLCPGKKKHLAEAGAHLSLDFDPIQPPAQESGTSSKYSLVLSKNAKKENGVKSGAVTPGPALIHCTHLLSTSSHTFLHI